MIRKDKTTSLLIILFIILILNSLLNGEEYIYDEKAFALFRSAQLSIEMKKFDAAKEKLQTIIEKYPYTREAQRAKELLKDIDDRKIKSEIDEAWELKNQNKLTESFDRLKQIKNKYPNCKYEKEINTRLNVLEKLITSKEEQNEKKDKIDKELQESLKLSRYYSESSFNSIINLPENSDNDFFIAYTNLDYKARLLIRDCIQVVTEYLDERADWLIPKTNLPRYEKVMKSQGDKIRECAVFIFTFIGDERQIWLDLAIYFGTPKNTFDVKLKELNSRIRDYYDKNEELVLKMLNIS